MKSYNRVQFDNYITLTEIFIRHAEYIIYPLLYKLLKLLELKLILLWYSF